MVDNRFHLPYNDNDHNTNIKEDMTNGVHYLWKDCEKVDDR